MAGKDALGGTLLGRDYIDMGAALAALGLELHNTVDEREERVVFTHSDVLAGLVFCAELAHEDVTGDDCLPAETLYATPLTS